MLSKTEVLAYWYKQKKYAIPMTNASDTSVGHRDSFVAVRGNNWLLALCTHPHATSSVAGFNSQAGIGLYLGRMGGIYPEFTFDGDKPWLLRMSANKSEWEISYDFESIEELHESILTFHKANALDQIYTRMETSRILFMSDADPCQGRIYQVKVQQANKVIEDGIETDDFLMFPYVTGYARIQEISLQEAARNILMKSELHDAALAESENLRLRIQKAIIKSTTMQELHEAYGRFKVELGRYGNL